jgi:hypothetical protein
LVARIFDRVCRPCEKFAAKPGSCTVCGCRVRRSGAALRNKIKMKTEHCPLDKW